MLNKYIRSILVYLGIDGRMSLTATLKTEDVNERTDDVDQ